MAEAVQAYKNHARLLPPFHFFVLPVLLLNVLNALRHLWRTPNPGTGFEVILAVALLTLAIMARNMVLTVQDRLIRLEMRLRLREILPPDLLPHVDTLGHRHLVALRFASNEELPGIVRDVLAGKLQSSKDIKLRVKNWQGDFLRA
jgi:hypothetical protein